MLSNTSISKAKPGIVPYRIKDEKGLCLEVHPAGGKRWRFRYRFAGKEKMLSLGLYPDVSLKAAREQRDKARELVAQGIDPSEVRKAEKEDKGRMTLEDVAREWHEKFRGTWSPAHALDIIQRLEKNVFPFIGGRQIDSITAPELLTVVRRIESRGASETARRILQMCGQIFRYGIATGRNDRDIAADLRGAIAPGKTRHHASITDPKKIGGLLRAMDEYQGAFVTLCALKLAPLLFVRPGELRHAEWEEFDCVAAEWRIPAHKMKRGRKHLVPLSRQALDILEALRPVTGEGTYLFPSIRSASRPISENTINAALRRLGYSSEEMTGHGFRSMASTLLNEQGWNRDAIERQLAHVEGNSVRAAYNYAEHLPERRKMMQAWADYLDALKAGGKVLPLYQAK